VISVHLYEPDLFGAQEIDMELLTDVPNDAAGLCLPCIRLPVLLPRAAADRRAEPFAFLTTE
jgi:hypothetical protein